MLLTDDELNERLDSPKNLMNRLKGISDRKSFVEVLPMSVGNKGPLVPDRVKELLGVIAIQSDETQEEVAEAFGVSQGLISQVSRGLDNTRVSADIKASIDAAKLERKEKTNEAHDEALDLLVGCLKTLKPQLGSIEKPEKLAKIATDMSKIISNVSKKDDDAKVNNTQVIIYAPGLMSESAYETIEA